MVERGVFGTGSADCTSVAERGFGGGPAGQAPIASAAVSRSGREPASVVEEKAGTVSQNGEHVYGLAQGPDRGKPARAPLM
jgi:hypothetical protein